MPKKSKWFVIATEGATTDGRKINREWLSQIAQNYDPKKYGARINLEHFRWRYFDKDDAHSYSYGDVLAVKTEENAEGKLQLLAQIEPTSALIKLVKEKQKVYTSVEIDLDFADSGEAYLVGLAVTDTPASLGTEYLTFCAGAKQNPLAERKQKVENLVSEAVEAPLEFSDEQTKSLSWLAKFRAKFSAVKADHDNKFAEHEAALEMLAEKFSELADQNDRLQTELTQLKAEYAEIKQQAVGFAEKFATLANEESKGYTQRPVMTGNKSQVELTDY
ncbi:GPO family capsid scaffolding protein [Muribacter muris]|uniref:GPO family capsid scaffolding protein n=1 Tax=Muribacter muris TaxID=67855 RepID=A0A4Y9K5G7_9PAST|nr:GPO family capsid scaffolding protein [Muribacter muris]MBF0783896.1 GPO family capsid scaffolding protein [Muribacter muris]MBF0826394.1 GPO family capsid scaffolding protein [Muribacter muris]TFV13293.1 GPO family capsid scaffolding protein [Muribacter muris]